MVNSKLIFGGIEGGATHSKMVLLDHQSKVLAQVEGPPTNHWLIGIEQVQNHIKALVDEAKDKIGLCRTKPLSALGLCLSGCEEESSNKELVKGLQERFPDVSETIFVASDTIGSLSTACENGGVIMISGTGTNCVLVNPNGKIYQSGGWGYMVGDEGSGFWICSRAVKIIFDEDDDLFEPPHSTKVIRELVFKHFNMKTRTDLLKSCYSNFNKSFFASMAVKVSEAASNGDLMSQKILSDAGFYLGRFLVSLSSKISPELYEGEHGLEVICTGSVFKSWDWLKPGFLIGVKPHLKKDKEIKKFTLLRLVVTSAIGAAYLGAKKYGCEIPANYSENSQLLFSYNASCHPVTNGINEGAAMNGFKKSHKEAGVHANGTSPQRIIN